MNPFRLAESRISSSGEPVLTRNEISSYETRRADLYPEVRQYADRLYAEVKKLYATYGVRNAAELYAKAKERQITVPKEDSKRLLRLQSNLESALSQNKLPEGYVGKFPPLEAYKNLLEKFKPTEFYFRERWENYEFIDGELNGTINNVNYSLPVICGELVRTVGDKGIECCVGAHNVGGKLNGTVRIYPDLWLPVMNGEFVYEVDGEKTKGFKNARNVNDSLNGELPMGSGIIPVINGQILREIEGHRIEVCDGVRNVNGKLNCRVRFSGGGRHDWLPVIGGELVREIDGQVIRGCSDIRNVDGKLNGAVDFGHGKILPVINGEPINEIEGQRIYNCSDVRYVDGRLNGVVEILDSDNLLRALPVVNGRLVREAGGMVIKSCKEFSDVGGVLNGMIDFEGRKKSIIRWNVILGEIKD